MHERWLKILDLLLNIIVFIGLAYSFCRLFKNQIVDEVTKIVTTTVGVGYFLWFTYGMISYRKSMPKISCWHKAFYIYIIIAVVAAILIQYRVN